jgi:hypothetical protein
LVEDRLSGNGTKPVVVYMVTRHPLESQNELRPFQWLHTDNGFMEEIKGLVGPFDPTNLDILVDDRPAGPAWTDLLDDLIEGKVQTVITHLAPLSPGQRQQLIGVCDYAGVRLVTPGDGGRNSFLSYRMYRS